MLQNRISALRVSALAILFGVPMFGCDSDSPPPRDYNAAMGTPSHESSSTWATGGPPVIRDSNGVEKNNREPNGPWNQR